jgi:WD40 repeat protein/serine/threonine protein kinase
MESARTVSPEMMHLLEAFDQAWQGGRPPPLEEFLRNAPNPSQVFRELVKIDLEHRWRLAGKQSGNGRSATSPFTPPVEDYVARWPDFGPVSLDLIAEEYRVRRRWGIGFDQAEYARRFPEQIVVLAPLFQEIDAELSQRSAASANTAVLDQSAPNEAILQGNGRHASVHIPMVPGYEILAELGRGGMGVVFKARQTHVNRLVALKMIRTGVHAGTEELTRFRNEAEAVARLQHPNIVALYEFGDYCGQPYFSQELVEGGNLSTRLSGTTLPSREAAELIATLAKAVHYAHQQGIVHRDLKPGNILLAGVRGQGPGVRESGQATSLLTPGPCPLTPVPKITDFGLAKRLDDELGQTQTGAVLGTPSYMAPEQAAGRRGSVGPAVDVYALGAILYECLTGRPPFRAATVVETLDLVRSAEVVSPRQLQPSLPRDLETIALKCLEKDPARRFSSALELANDLERFLNNEPIRARPISRPERLVKWARRAPALAGLLALSVLGVLGIFGGVALHNTRLRTEITRAEKGEKEAREQEANAQASFQQAVVAQNEVGKRKAELERLDYQHRVALSLREWESGNVRLTESLLDGCAPDQRGWEWYYCRRLCNLELRTLGISWTPLAVAYSPDGKTVASLGAATGRLKLWAAASRDLLWQVAIPHLNMGSRGSNQGHPMAFNPDGKKIAAGSCDGSICICDVSNGKKSAELQGPGKPVLTLAWSPDGKSIASFHLEVTDTVNWGGGPGWLLLWDAASGKVRHSIHLAGHVHGIAFSPDSKQLAIAGFGSIAVQLFNVASGTLASLALQDNYFGAQDVAFSPNGKILACADGTYKRIQLWDTATGARIRALDGHTGTIRQIVFSHDGSRVASAAEDNTVKIWDVGGARELFTIRGHRQEISSLAFSPDDRELATGCEDGLIRIWDATRPRDIFTTQPMGGDIAALAFRQDGALVYGNGFALWACDPATGNRLMAYAPSALHALCPSGPSHTAVTFSSDSKRLAIGGGMVQPDRPLVRLWDGIAGKEIGLIGRHDDWVTNVAYSKDGRMIASIGDDEIVKVWDPATRKELFSFPARSSGKPWHTERPLAFSPDGRLLAVAGRDLWIKIWDVAVRRELRDLKGHTNLPLSLVFTHDSTRLISGSLDKTIRVWELSSGNPIFTLRGHSEGVRTVALSPDGKRIASGGHDRTIKLWDAATGQEMLTLHGIQGVVRRLDFSADGNRLAASTSESLVYVWQACSPADASRLNDANAANDRAWPMVWPTECTFETAVQALPLAERAVQGMTWNGWHWKTLGVAQFRAHQWRKSIDALTKSMELMERRFDCPNMFFIAMAHCRLGDKKTARLWFNRGVSWMEDNARELKSNSWQWPESIRYRTEAHRLLEVGETQ